MKKTIKCLLIAGTMAAAIGFAACNFVEDEYSSSSHRSVLQTHTIYRSSASSSDYLTKTLNGVSTVDVTDGKTPDIFVVNLETVNQLSTEEVNLMYKTVMAGKTVLFDSPSKTNLNTFQNKVVNLLDDEESAKVKNAAFNLENLFAAINSTEADTLADEYEAIGVRQGQIYYVHKVDAIEGEVTYDEAETGSLPKPDNSMVSELTGTTGESIVLPEDYETAKNSSIEKFTNWVNLTNSKAANNRAITQDGRNYVMNNKPELASAMDDLKTAQTVYHSYTVKYIYPDTVHYHGRYNNKCENVELTSDVWTMCSIDNQIDYFIVRTSLVCNNGQLGCANNWSDDKSVGPYFRGCILSPVVHSSQHLRTNDCSPQTSTGSTSYSSGVSISMGGNIGISASGPSGGISGSVSFSESTTRSIPDVSIFLTQENNVPEWTYSTPAVQPGWSGLYTKCDSPVAIETNTAIFDSYCIVEVASNLSTYFEKYHLVDTTSIVRIGMTQGWLDGLFSLEHENLVCRTTLTFHDLFKKPNNACCQYIMSFTPPAGVTPESQDRLHNIIKDYITDWNDNVPYYTIGESNLNNVAKDYFAEAKKKIETNKNVLKERGFAGTYTFYIQNVSTGVKAASFNLSF